MSATISKAQVQRLAKTMESISNVLTSLTVNDAKTTKQSKVATKQPKVAAKSIPKIKKKAITSVASKKDLKKYTVSELSTFADKHQIKYEKKLKEILIKKIWKYLCSLDSDSDSSDSDSDSDSDSSDSDSDSESDNDSSDSDSDSD